MQVLPPVLQLRELRLVALIEWIGREEAETAREALQPEDTLPDAREVESRLLRQLRGRCHDVEPEQHRHDEVAEVVAKSGCERAKGGHPLQALKMPFLGG